MKATFARACLVPAFLSCVAAFAPVGARAQQDEGERLFNQICVACHTINKGKLVGPDLVNVHKRRPEDWLIRFIKSSQSVINSGDEYAMQLFEKYNKQLMPDNAYTDAQVLAIIAYIAANSPDEPQSAQSAQSAKPEAPARPVTEEDVRSGQRLFEGNMRFENGGPACSSCHDVQYDGIMAGGALAKDLTDAYARLSGVGVKAMIASSPFPAMRQAFAARPLTDEELFDVTAFLQHAGKDGNGGQPPQYGARLFFSGLGGSIVLLGLFSGLWIRSKKRSVNHDIYGRQVKSTWE